MNEVPPFDTADVAGSKTGVDHLPLTIVLKEAVSVATEGENKVYVVGGIVRDLLVGRSLQDADLDLVVEGDGGDYARRLALRLGATVKEHPTFLTAKLLAPFFNADSLMGGGPSSSSPGDDNFFDKGAGITRPVRRGLSEVDVATARSETYSRSGALPTVHAASLQEDLFRRDFSINAIALPLSAFLATVKGATGKSEGLSVDDANALRQAVIDPCGGLDDLDNRILRVLHADSFVDDPTRLFRLARYLTKISGVLDNSTERYLKGAVAEGVMREISTRRIWNELVACAREPQGAEMLESCIRWELFDREPFANPQVQHAMVATVAALYKITVDRPLSSERVELVLLTALFGSQEVMSNDRASNEKSKDVLKELQITKVMKRDLFAVLGEKHPLVPKGSISPELISLSSDELSLVQAIVAEGVGRV